MDLPSPSKSATTTDIGPDCDDVAALMLLYALADRGEGDIIGMMCCTSSEWGAACLDARNAHYGRLRIPVGTLKDSGFLEHSACCRPIAQRYPHRLKSAKEAKEESVTNGVWTLIHSTFTSTSRLPTASRCTPGLDRRTSKDTSSDLPPLAHAHLLLTG